MARLIDGTTTVAAAGTPVALGTGRALAVQIVAHENNAGTVVVGASTVVAASATRRGVPLEASEPMSINAGHSQDGGGLDLAAIFVDATVNGQVVTWAALQP